MRAQLYRLERTSLVVALACQLLLAMSTITDECRGQKIDRSIRSLPQTGSATAKISRRVELLNRALSQLKESNSKAAATADQSSSSPIPDEQKPEESASSPSPPVVKRTYIEDPSLARRDPKYMDACDKRTEIAIKEAPTSDHPRFTQHNNDSRAHIQPETIKQLVIAARQRVKNYQSSPPKRSKRSIFWHAGDDHNSLGMMFDPQGKSSLYSRKSTKSNSNHLAVAKKTSFVLSSRRQDGNNNKNKNRYYHTTDTVGIHQAAPPSAKQANDSATVGGDQAACDSLISNLRANDLRSTWQINCLRDTINHIRAIPGALIRQIDRELASENLIASDEIVNKTNGQLRTWMPSAKSLLKTAPAFNESQETSRALTSLSQEMQFFSLILEQMIFEQVAVDKKFVQIYRDIEGALLKLQCDMEILIPLLSSQADDVEQLSRLRERNKDKAIVLQRRHEELLQFIDRRLRQSRGIFESPFERLMGGGAQMLRKIGDNLYIKREVMPVQLRQPQRSSGASLDRMLRDQLVFKDMSELLGHLEAILVEIS